MKDVSVFFGLEEIFDILIIKPLYFALNSNYNVLPIFYI